MFTDGKLVKEKYLLFPWLFMILHIFLFSFDIAFSVALQLFENISLMFAVLYRFWSKQSSERSRF